MVDRVKPLKIEGTGSGGTQNDDFPTSTDKNEDFLDARGYCVQDDSSNDDLVRVSRDGDDMTFLDKSNTVKTLSDLLSGGMSPATHRQLDQLVHELDEDYYEEYTYTSSKLTNVTVWTTSGKTKKIREYAYTYTGIKITQEIITQYDSDGNWSERLTLAYVYTGAQISNITSVRTTP